ncbi:MAG: secretin N-terminal domain-containing protein, partial [Geminicoccaceae bacterium]
MAFLIVSCSPKATVEPDRAVPIEAPILPAASFSTLRPESPDETRLPEPYIEKGSGDYITSKAEIGVSPGQTGGKNLSLNFVDIEIRELLDKVLGDQLNLDYIIDPKVDGRITVRTSDELPSDDILSILDSVLNLNGAALVEDGGLYKVLPIDEVISSGITPEIRKVDNVGRFGFGVEIVPIKYISIEKLPELLQPILSNDSTIQINSQRNTALLVGPRSELNTLVSTIKIFDVDWMEGMSFGLFDLQYADAANLSEELGRIFAGFADIAATSIVRFIPIKRLNSIIVVAAQPSYLDRARSWIERLDKAAEGSDEQVYFYSVQNGRASDLARVLSSIFEIEQRIIGGDEYSQNDHKPFPGFNPIEFENTFDEEELAFDEYADYVSRQTHRQRPEYIPPSIERGKREARIV